VRRAPLSGGVRLTVTGTPVPVLRMMSADGGRMLLRQGTRDVLLARVDHDHYGVHLRVLPGWRSPVPPVTAADARRLGGDPVRWAHWFADALTEPLHDGDWVLTNRSLPGHVLGGDLVRTYPESYLDWFGTGWQGAVPLRALSEVDSSRVKAYRKLGADLPPVLLLAQTGFDGYVVLDGHDRLVAALAAGITPPALVLARAGDGSWLPAVTARHEELMRRVDERGRDALARRFAEVVAALPEETARTMAWPMPGGTAEWDRIAADAGFDPDLT
jgi:hypothetical protein